MEFVFYVNALLWGIESILSDSAHCYVLLAACQRTSAFFDLDNYAGEYQRSLRVMSVKMASRMPTIQNRVTILASCRLIFW